MHGTWQKHHTSTRSQQIQRAALSIENVAVRFGGVAALDGASFTVGEGEICGVIGPNGAGKTTLFNAVSGIARVTEGAITFRGTRLDKLPPHRISALGIARTFQNLGLYAGMTVLDNVLLGGHLHTTGGLLASALHLPQVARSETALRHQAIAIIEELGLEKFAEDDALQLPYGTMKRIEIARALMSRPRLLLLDEPAGGLSHEEVDEFSSLLRGLRKKFDLTVLLVEHHVKLVMSLCDHVVVLHLGATLADGTPAEVQQDEAVRAAYLGDAA